MPGHRKRRQFKQTDAFTRGMVIGLKRAGWSIRQIAADTHLGASTVHRLWRRWLEQGNVAIYRNAGATRVTSARVDRHTLDHSFSTRTISRRLVANGLHSCRPLRRLSLTPPNRRQRLARSTWMTEWHRVVFSDESRFCLSSDSRRVRVWHRRGERSNPAAIVERPTVRQRGIMVWGAIAYDSRSPLLRIQSTMTAQRYVDDVLRPVTLPYLQGAPNALYQQDNARPHTARISQQALQDVQMLPWPPYSPDLSPIEHVWDIIGRRLHALPQPRSEDELWQMVEREWRAIPQDAIRTLIDSLPRRVAACIARLKATKLRHIETNHREQMNNPISYFENIRSSFQKQSKKFKKFMTTSDEAQTASYMIAQLIARKKKAHAEAEEIILPALKIVAGCMLTNDAMEKVTKIPLSSKTIARRIEDMSEDIALQIKQSFNDSSTKWAIQLDETTDISNKAQLLAFLRFVDTGKIVNNYFFCKELKQRTTGADIFELVDENVMKYNLRWENCVSVCTDGAPAMKGSRKGLIAHVIKKNPNIKFVHCMIHREMLVSKSVPPILVTTLDEVVKVVNYIKSNALRSRIFSTFCEAMDSDYKNLLFHTEVRWLSKGKVLNRFISMKNEIMAFIDNEEINFPFMMSDVWWLRVSFLGDIFDKLNSLNLNLQGAQENIITISTKLKAFKEKLSLWNLNIAKENFASFPMVQENPSKSIIKKEVEETLTLLSASFDKYFPYLDVEKMEWVVNPFMHCEIQHLEEEMQENLIDLKNDLVFKRLYTEKELSEFWLCLNSKFPKLSNAAIESLLSFGSSYLCEQGFSTLTEMKSKKRERLQMIDEEMRVCLSQELNLARMVELADNNHEATMLTMAVFHQMDPDQEGTAEASQHMTGQNQTLQTQVNEPKIMNSTDIEMSFYNTTNWYEDMIATNTTFNFTTPFATAQPRPYYGDILADVKKCYMRFHGYLSVLVCIFGIFANVLNIIVLTRKEMISSTNLILTGLAVTDMLVMSSYLPFAFHNYVRSDQEPHEKYSYSWALFTLFYAHFTVVCHTISTWLTVTLAVWRFMAISLPAHSRKWCSMTRAKWAIAATYFNCMAFCLPSYFTFTIRKEYLENGKATYMVDFSEVAQANNMFLRRINFWIFSVLAKLVPCIALTGLSLGLIRLLYEANNRKKRLRQNAHCDRTCDRTTRMLLAVLLLFLITEFPSGILALLSGILGDDFYKNVYSNLGEIMDVLALINSAINFILYCAMSRQFREIFSQLFTPRIMSKWMGVTPEAPTVVTDVNTKQLWNAPPCDNVDHDVPGHRTLLISPIEHVWDIIGRRLHALPQPRSEDELWQMVEREWRAIPQDAIRTLIDSLT
ncbi:hypothetical protein LAZ67_10003027 [Cordylochernes scorpioides]|uniref:G-protein coupled receptors family 1 profile domain-containing protein n=1 Tax=Cordylochernes scorpioides TaxID=51811 RepID=A0ABY6KWZ4_9ARAC|nr:hypothetical protein LAZ67_10003027 [Cordylochernes scorpioides]